MMIILIIWAICGGMGFGMYIHAKLAAEGTPSVWEVLLSFFIIVGGLISLAVMFELDNRKNGRSDIV